MTREQNLQAMMQLNAARSTVSDPDQALAMHAAYYTHQLIEAILSGNIASIATAQ